VCAGVTPACGCPPSPLLPPCLLRPTVQPLCRGCTGGSLVARGVGCGGWRRRLVGLVHLVPVFCGCFPRHVPGLPEQRCVPSSPPFPTCVRVCVWQVVLAVWLWVGCVRWLWGGRPPCVCTWSQSPPSPHPSHTRVFNFYLPPLPPPFTCNVQCRATLRSPRGAFFFLIAPFTCAVGGPPGVLGCVQRGGVCSMWFSYAPS
jgi:hypothetical protein